MTLFHGVRFMHHRFSIP